MLDGVIYKFNNIVLDTDNFSLLVDGEISHVEPQVFNIIVYLLENRGRVLSRSEILEHLWKGKVVSDSSISNYIKSARKILGDDGQKQAIIKTLHGRGYQFIVEEIVIVCAEDNQDKQLTPVENGTVDQTPIVVTFNKNLWYLGVLVMILAAIIFMKWPQSLPKKQPVTTVKLDRSIAILPFKNHNALASDQHFGDGIHDDLVTQISKIKSIKVMSRTSVMRYKGTLKDIQTIGQELGVLTILEGGIQRSEKAVRVNVQLIDASTDQHLWAETYTREVTSDNVFDIQSELSKTITQELSKTLIEFSNTIYTPQQVAYALSDGLIGYYPFNGNAYDESGHHNHGSASDVVLSTDRLRKKSAYEFNGSSSVISIANSASLMSPTQEFTAVVWINAYGWSKVGEDFGPILMKSNSRANNFQYRLFVSNGGLTFAISNWYNRVTFPINLAFNEWHMLAITMKNGTVDAYYDGEHIGADTVIGPIYPNTMPLEIGHDVGGTLKVFHGKIDDVRLYNRKLMPREIKTLFNQDQASL